MLTVELVPGQRITDFRQLVEAYWQEIMPQASTIQTAAQREIYFNERFTWSGEERHPYWATRNSYPIGFVSFAIETARKWAQVEDFYVIPRVRRQGVGTALGQWLFSHLDSLGIEQIDLNVRRDNPAALAFWQAQGFGIALYRLRQYRDPATGTAFVGALSSDFSADEV